MATPNNFINQGIAIVKDAIQADNDQKYEDAYGLYKKSLEYFMTGIKHEKNPAMKDTIMKRAVGYMDRAEQLKKVGWCELQSKLLSLLDCSPRGGTGATVLS